MSEQLPSENRTIRWLRNTVAFALVAVILYGYVWVSLKLMELNS